MQVRKTKLKPLTMFPLHHEGEVFGLVGESGSGKTMVGRYHCKLYDYNAGDILFDGQLISQSFLEKI